MLRMTCNYLSGRQDIMQYNGKSSTTKSYKNGVPHISELSPTVFNMYMHSISIPEDPHTHVLAYADDLRYFTTPQSWDLYQTNTDIPP